MSCVFALGSNGSGQLGIGHEQDVSVPKPLKWLSQAPTSPIISIAAGGNHTLLLSQAGQLYWAGDATSGSCGLVADATPAKDVSVFRELRLSHTDKQELGPVAMIAATWEASFVVALDSQGKQMRLYSFGTGTKGELGCGEALVRTPTASQIKGLPVPGTEIVCLAACMDHVVVVLDNGHVYGWGNGRKSQIGEPSAVVYTPRKLQGIGFKVVKAVCTKESTCLLGDADSGDICVMGSDKWHLSSEAPSRAPAWLDAGAGWGTIYILAKNGSLIAWGRGHQGQLPPRNLPALKRIAIGSEHVVALTYDGDVISWGWGEHGNCGPSLGQDDVKDRWNVIASSKFIPSDSRIHCIGAGCATSWICITENQETKDKMKQ
ncbi:hypothetical protein CDD82_4507 [Ophiocordyceps australis]|uniref:RCC1-like domain-containing protein n=1 Tax=Ophiocordyceps australis TaxID=1399860 RepID=A0A2C5Y4S6_9HYPO|nr:hypothetical protein CDD82_4507 [Ophiocordyceps australis]